MNEVHQEVYQGVLVPEPAWITPLRKEKYGSVPGLEDEEPADPEELERQINRQVWGPVLMLAKPKASHYSPAWDCSADVDFNAFASVDFDRTQPVFDKALYKADKLKEQLKDVLIRFDILKERIPGMAKYKVLKYLKMGVIELGDIASMDMYWLGELYLRARRLQREIVELRKASLARRIKRAKAFWDSLG